MEESYQNNLEHIYDELLLVDLNIHAEILKFRAANKDQKNDFKGLYISDAEIDELLKEDKLENKWIRKSTDSAGIDYDKLIEAINKFSKLVSKRIENTLKKGTRLNILELGSLYNLNPKELEILVICLVHQIDTKYSKLFSYLQNDVTKKNPGVDLILNLICSTFESRISFGDFFSPQSPLFKYHLLEYIDDPLETEKPFLLREVKLSNRIREYLLDGQYIDDELSLISQIYTSRITLKELILPKKISSQLKNFINYYNKQTKRIEKNFIFSFFGAYGSEKLEIAAALCNELKLSLLVIDLAALFNSGIRFERGIDLVLRESNILPCALYFKNIDFIFSQDEKQQYRRQYFINALDESSWLTFLTSEISLRLQGKFSFQKFVEVELSNPGYDERKTLWSKYLTHSSHEKDLNIKELSGKFNLTGGQIKEAVITAANQALWRLPEENKITYNDLVTACRMHSNQRLNDLAVRIKPRYKWGDIVLPYDKITVLREIVNMVKYKHIVFDEWGFEEKIALGKGISVLFYGEPGTGKTMAGDIIANELEMDMYKIDISTIVSKFIGETEKNLSKIFTEAESSNAIIFFDEADALLGKRTEVKDSHDRYANIEVSYLLQKIDEYPGIVIMATNYVGNIDEAFERRLNFSVRFPFPDRESRIKIWENIYPEKMPLSSEINYEMLADKFKVSGGNIKNIALASAFYAAESEEEVNLEHILQACRREYDKIGRLWDDADIGVAELKN